MPIIYTFSPRFLCCHSQEVYNQEVEEEIQASMVDRTKRALMSYEIVEERSEEIIQRIQKSTFGDYAEKVAVIIPFVTGKVQFKVKNLRLSYSHFSDKLNLGYDLAERWQLFMDKKQRRGEMDARSGVKYSFRF